MMGTPAYMAPEQVMGQDVDGRADLYAVGVVLFRLLTSNLPFKADTAIAMVQKQIKDQPTPLRQFRAELPAWCEQILDRALAKPPGERFQTAEEFRAALTRSTALAPPSEVTSILAATPLAPDLEVTVAPDTVPIPVSTRDAPADAQPAPSTTGAVRTQTPVPLEPTLVTPVQTPAAPPVPTPAPVPPPPRPSVPAPGASRRSSPAPLIAGGLVLLAIAVLAFVMWRLVRQGAAPETASVSPPVTAPAHRLRSPLRRRPPIPRRRRPFPRPRRRQPPFLRQRLLPRRQAGLAAPAGGPLRRRQRPRRRRLRLRFLHRRPNLRLPRRRRRCFRRLSSRPFACWFSRTKTRASVTSG